MNNQYYKELSKVEVLTDKQVKDLIIKAKEGDASATNKIIESHLKLVVHYAKQYIKITNDSSIIEIDDLINEGNIGLILSIDKFKPNLNVPFRSYAIIWIKKMMCEFIQKNQHTIRIPLNIYKTQIKIQQLLEKPIEEISTSELENLEMLTDNEIKHFHNKPVKVQSEKYEEIGEEVELEFEVEDFKLFNQKRVEQMIRTLKPKHQKILKARFGIGEPKQTLIQIAEKFKLTKQRVGQIEQAAIKKLQELFNPEKMTTEEKIFEQLNNLKQGQEQLKVTVENHLNNIEKKMNENE